MSHLKRKLVTVRRVWGTVVVQSQTKCRERIVRTPLIVANHFYCESYQYN